MYRLYVRVCCIAALVAGHGAAQPRPTTVSSSQPFRLSGVTVPAGVPTWPVYPGDTITTLGSPAVISTNDGAVIQLGASSQALVGRSGSATTVRVQSGTVVYTLPASSTTQLSTDSGPAKPGTSVVTSVAPASIASLPSSPSSARVLSDRPQPPPLSPWRR